MDAKMKPVIIYALFQIAILEAAYFEFQSGNSLFHFGDITNLFQPICTFIGKAASTGYLPLWKDRRMKNENPGNSHLAVIFS